MGIEQATLWFAGHTQSTEPHQPGLIFLKKDFTLRVYGNPASFRVRRWPRPLSVTTENDCFLNNLLQNKLSINRELT